MENLREQYSCAEDNLNSKRAELEEKTELIDSMQEKIVEMTAELATYKNNTDTSKWPFQKCHCINGIFTD